MHTQIAVRARNGHPPVIELCGDIDFNSASHVMDIANGLIRSGQKSFCVDCAGVGIVDSSGLSAFIRIHRMVGDVGGHVHLVALPEQLLRTITITGLNHVLGIIPSSNDGTQVHDIRRGDYQLIRTVVRALPETVSDVRRDIADLVGAMAFTRQQVEDITLAVGEAISNAVRHGSPRGEVNSVTVQCERFGDRFVVQVSDEGCGFDPEAIPCTPQNPMIEGGRGIYLMRALMDHVSFTFNTGTSVRLEKLVTQATPILTDLS